MSFSYFFSLDANLTERLDYLFSYQIVYKYDLEAIHLILTWLWIVLGCLAQFIIVSCNISRLDFLSLTWKLLIVLSSALLLGPTMIYLYCIVLIASFKLKLSAAPATVMLLRRQVDRALSFAGQSKLSEILVESLPQLMTQLVMLSAKGNDGSRVLSPVQRLSVFSSAITILLGTSKYVIDANGEYVSKVHLKLTSRLIIILLLVSELCFCGGICMFSFAFPGRYRHIAFTIPFLLISTNLGIVSLMQSSRCKRCKTIFRLATKLCVWAYIIVIFFESVHKSFHLLDCNNSKYVFIITMSFFMVFDVTMEYVVQHQGINSKLYTWVNTLLVATISNMAESGSHSLENQNTILTQNPEMTESSASGQNYEYMSNISDVTDVEVAMSNKKTYYDNKAMNDASASAITGSSGGTTDTTESVFTISDEVAEQSSEAAMTTNDERPQNRGPMNRRHLFCNCCCPFIICFFLFGALCAILFHPLNFKAEPYRLELVNYGAGGFPVVLNKEGSAKGSICVKGMSAERIVRIGLVIARQRSVLANRRHLIGELSYPKNLEANLKYPFLYPTCTGEENHLIECEQYGLGVAIPDNCFEGNSRLYFSAGPEQPSAYPPDSVHFITEIPMNHTAAKTYCQKIGSIYVGRLERKSDEKPRVIQSNLISDRPDNEVGWVNFAAISIPGLWTNSGPHYDYTNQSVLFEPEDYKDKKFSVICKVYNHFYGFYCGDHRPGCDTFIQVWSNNSAFCAKERAVMTTASPNAHAYKLRQADMVVGADEDIAPDINLCYCQGC